MTHSTKPYNPYGPVRLMGEDDPKVARKNILEATGNCELMKAAITLRLEIENGLVKRPHTQSEGEAEI